MSLLSYIEICELIEQGVIENTSYDRVNSASLDLTLGATILAESMNSHNSGVIVLRDKQGLPSYTHNLSENPYYLIAGEFILAQSQQIFHLPNNISAEYKLNSSMARIGLEHLNAGWCDAGWHGSVLTLELKNMLRNHTIKLQYGDKIGQIVFFRHTQVPDDKSYSQRGRYNNDATVSGVKAG